ncbi:MAG: archease [Candidatus Colwellbacteria bacterium]|nr:archease [Candidatus Colwellbacteria bacterium]
MPYEIIDHTADIKIRVRGNTLQNLFLEAATAMTELMKPLQIPDRHEYVKTPERKIIVEAPDTTALLIDFLSEVLALSQTNKEIYNRMTFSHFSPTKVEAVLGEVRVEKFDEDIKAVTYHEADVRQNEKGEWETMIVFDI